MSHTGCFDRHRWIQHIFGAACGQLHTLNQLHLDHYSLPTCYIHRLRQRCSASAPSSSVFPYTPFSVFAGVANMTEHRWNADTDLPKCLLYWWVQRYTENRNHVQHCKALWQSSVHNSFVPKLKSGQQSDAEHVHRKPFHRKRQLSVVVKKNIQR